MNVFDIHVLYVARHFHKLEVSRNTYGEYTREYESGANSNAMNVEKFFATNKGWHYTSKYIPGYNILA